MIQAVSRYSDWKAPGQDGRMLIWPEPATIARQTRENARQLAAADDVLLQRIPLPELRRAQRQWIGHKDDGQFLIATGHQTELFHPGVWVKNVLINTIAHRLDGAAFHFAVETDAPKHLHVRWPGESFSITDDARQNDAAWTGLLEGPSPAHVDGIQLALEQAAKGWTFAPMAFSLLSSIKRLTLESSNLAWLLTNAIHQLEWELGLRHHAMLAGPMWMSPAYLVMVHHILAGAERFAAGYNAALAEFRGEQGIRSAGRPWPDLRVSDATCEAPFWMDSLAMGTRDRAMVIRDKGAWKIVGAGGEEFLFRQDVEGWSAAEELARFLRRNDMVLSPRALILTMFFRMFIADQFVHGIGGGRYDQVTDRVIASYFGIQPPAFSVTTATMYFPEALDRPRINLRPVLLEGRRLRHGLLSEQKMRMVEQIQSLPRHSRERSRLFHEMHAKLQDGLTQPMFQQWEARLEETRQLAAAQAPLFDREMFFGMQPRERLLEMVGRYDELAAKMT